MSHLDDLRREAEAAQAQADEALGAHLDKYGCYPEPGSDEAAGIDALDAEAAQAWEALDAARPAPAGREPEAGS